MVGRDIQRLEVMPLVFNFGAQRDGEAEPPHDVLEFLDGLSDGMQPSQAEGTARNRGVEIAIADHARPP